MLKNKEVNSSFKPTRYYKYNLKTGKKRLVLKGNEKYFNVQFDNDANPISSTGYDIRFWRIYRLLSRSGR